jgi:amino acid transporter
MHTRLAMKVPALRPRLRRSLSLTLIVLYGLGVTIGAGIYALVGEVAGLAGGYAPLAFVIAGLVMIGPLARFTMSRKDCDGRCLASSPGSPLLSSR